jgi:hypothetical protein
MNRCAVVIRVNKTGDLPVLNAAVSGAKEVAQWTTEQGIQVTPLALSVSVSLDDIKNAIRTFVYLKAS